MHDAPQIRELFIDELEQVHGGGPVEDVMDIVERIKPAPIDPGGGIISDPPVPELLPPRNYR